MTDQEVLLPETGEATQAIAESSARKQVSMNPAQLLQLAIENNSSIETMERLMDLQDRHDAKEAERAFVAALNAFKANPPKLIKNKHVSFPSKDGKTEYDHATLDHISEEVGKALSEHGIAHRWKVHQGGINGADPGKIEVSCILTHKDGHSESVSIYGYPDESGKKNRIQQVASTITYLQRYTLLAATGLAPANVDDDGIGSEIEYIDENQKNQIVAGLKNLGSDNDPELTKTFLNYLNVDNLDDLPADDFSRAMQAIAAKQKKLDTDNAAA